MRALMNGPTQRFCELVRSRSREHREAMHVLARPPSVVGPRIAILRQELDSMVRVVFLLTRKDLNERLRLIEDTLSGRQWRVPTPKGKMAKVTDRMMVEIAQGLKGWTKSVYSFGCAFIHLSDFHGHLDDDPFSRLPKAEREAVLHHLRHYHGGPATDTPTLREISRFSPGVLRKITGNLDCYVQDLEQGKSITLEE